MAHMHTVPHAASVQFESPDCDFLFFFVIHTVKYTSKLKTLPGGQTAVCHLDAVRFSATKRPGSRQK